MPKIDLTEIRRLQHQQQDLNDYIDSFLADKCSSDDPPYLTDLILSQHRGGSFVLVALGDHYEMNRDNAAGQFRWRIKVLRDEWGNLPSPGDLVRRRKQLPEYSAPDKPIPAQDISVMKATGEYEKRFVRWNDYRVDEKGCITCAFADAVWFLRCFGRAPMSIHVDDKSLEPVDTPCGDKLHVWYYRYDEVSAEGYERLPQIQKREGHRRGFEKAPPKPIHADEHSLELANTPSENKEASEEKAPPKKTTK